MGKKRNFAQAGGGFRNGSPPSPALLHVNKLSNAVRAAVEAEAALAERNFGSSANQSQKFARSLAEAFSAPLSAHTPRLSERPIGSASTTGDPQRQHILSPI
jgi:hypothetical protein